jgi:hypothetical protein
MNPLFLPDILCRMLEEGLRLQFGSLPKHLSAQAALPDELDELGSLDHNPKRHPPPRPASTNNSTKRPKIVPAQRSILIVVSGQVSLSVDSVSGDTDILTTRPIRRCLRDQWEDVSIESFGLKC